MTLFLSTLIGLIASIPVSPANAHGASLLIQNARLIDGTRTRPRPDVAILLQDGHIAAIGADVTAPNAPMLDVRGATVLPGLIDAHVHAGVVPGSGQRRDPPGLTRALRRQHLRAYLACGVTTILDTQIDPEVAHDIQGWLAAGHAGPRFLTLGPGFVTPGGYLSDSVPSVTTVDDVEAQFARLQSLGAVGVKVFVERGFGLRPVWPIPSPEIRAAIVRSAAVRRLPIYVHAEREADMTVALDMGARAIVHGGFYDASPSEGFVRRMAESGTYLVTTFSLMDAHPLDDPLFRGTVPARERATARDPASRRFLERAQIGMAEPLVPWFLRGLVARFMLTESTMARRLASSQRAVQRLSAAGVPVVAGSDSGNWPIDPYHFHGTTTLREIELVGQAGLSPMAAIMAATRVPAEMLGLADEIGTVEVGKRADLVIVRDDPLRDLRALRTVEWTIKDGTVHTPEEWMRQP